MKLRNRAITVLIYLVVFSQFVSPTLWAEEQETKRLRYKGLAIRLESSDSLIDREEIIRIKTDEPITEAEFEKLMYHTGFKSFLKMENLYLRKKSLFELSFLKKEIPSDVIKEVTFQLGIVNHANVSTFQLGLINEGHNKFGRFGFINRNKSTHTMYKGTSGTNIAIWENDFNGDLTGASFSLGISNVDGDLQGLSTSLIGTSVSGDLKGVLGSGLFNSIGGFHNGVLAGCFNKCDNNRAGVTLGILKNGDQWYSYLDWVAILTFIIFGSFLRFRSLRTETKNEKSLKGKRKKITSKQKKRDITLKNKETQIENTCRDLYKKIENLSTPKTENKPVKEVDTVLQEEAQEIFRASQFSIPGETLRDIEIDKIINRKLGYGQEINDITSSNSKNLSSSDIKENDKDLQIDDIIMRVRSSSVESGETIESLLARD